MNINKVKERVESIKKEGKKTNNPLLFRHTFTINLEHDILLSKLVLKNDVFYMRFPDSKNSYFGFDIALEYNINSRIEFNNLEKIKHETTSNIKEDNVILFGFSSFNMDTVSKEPWKNIPKGYFCIPKFLITFANKKCYLTYTLKIDSKFSEKRIINDFNEISAIIDNKIKKYSEKKITLKERIFTPDKKTYLNDVNNILSQFKNKQYSKIVLSRIEEYILSKEIPVNLIMQALLKEYPECFNFMIGKKNYYFIGSSPEELIKINDRNYYTHALAGTSKQQDLLNNKKELEEHEYVISHIKNILKPLSTQIDIDKNNKPLKLNYAYHLKTPIKGQFKKKEHALSILQKLYPTPALAGSPINESKKIIDTLEKFDRGWYGGAAGFYTNNGNGKFYVPIRSCFIKSKKVYFYSGAGIVKKSEAIKEWEETKIKLEHMKSIFNQLIQDKVN